MSARADPRGGRSAMVVPTATDSHATVGTAMSLVAMSLVVSSLSMGKNANVNQQQPLSATVNAQTSVTGIGRTGL